MRVRAVTVAVVLLAAGVTTFAAAQSQANGLPAESFWLWHGVRPQTGAVIAMLRRPEDGKGR